MVDGCWHRIQTHFCSWRTESLSATPQSYLNAAGGVKFELNAYTVFKSLTMTVKPTKQIRTVKIHAVLPIQKIRFCCYVLKSFSFDKPFKKTDTSLPRGGVLSVQLPWWRDLKQHAMGKQGAFSNPKINCPVCIYPNRKRQKDKLQRAVRNYSREGPGSRDMSAPWKSSLSWRGRNLRIQSSCHNIQIKHCLRQLPCEPELRFSYSRLLCQRSLWHSGSAEASEAG